jgi:hypothetical protein
MRKVASILFSVLIVAAAFVSNVAAQPQVAYITPDAGAPGMCVVVDIIAPETAHGTFGPDVPYLALAGHPEDSIVQLVKTSDNALVRIGPAVVSWDGREISQMVMIEPNVPQLDTSIQLVVFYNNQKSTPFTFHIYKPRHVASIETDPAHIRSPRNTWVLDSLILKNRPIFAAVSDPDNSTPGNQAYLPVRVLCTGPIRLDFSNIAVLGGSGSTGSLGGGVGNNGGGGGGGGYPGKGGFGYSGGGGNGDGANGPGGVGSGSTSGNNSWDGGKGLSGVSGGTGEQHPGATSNGPDDGGGGGTGHPFGSSGQNGSGNNPGGYGGGSAGSSTSDYTHDFGGGGGGFATDGTQGQGGGDNAGKSHGNRMLVPLAGGSGGGAGNNSYTYIPFVGNPTPKAGSGGGGGGAMELTSFADVQFSQGGGLTADGGKGSDAVVADFTILGQPQHLTAAGGGGGSGGSISVAARDSIVIGTGTIFKAQGGNGGVSSDANSNGGDGGQGRVRIDGYVSKVSGNTSFSSFFTPSKDYTGPSIQKVLQTKDSLIVIGHAEYWGSVPSIPLPIDIRWQWSGTSVWQSCVNNQPWCPTLVVDPASHTAMWRDTIPISQDPSDTEVYIVAIQREPLPVSGSPNHSDVPAEVMSHTSGIIVAVTGPPKALVKTNIIDFGNVRVGNCSKDTTFKVYSIGKSELAITSVKVIGPNASQFTIKTSAPPSKYVRPKDSASITLQFCPTRLECPIFDTLRIITTDSSRDIVLRGCAIAPLAKITPLDVDFGLVHVGDCKDTTITISNIGTDVLIVTRESIGDTTHFKTFETLPQTLQPSSSLSLHLRFCPTDVPIVTSYDTIEHDAAQSPIIVKLHGGGKIGVLSIPKQLDFNQVRLGPCRDAGFYAVNSGSDTISITSELLGSSKYSIVSPFPPFTIQPHDSTYIQLRYCPLDTSQAPSADTLYSSQGGKFVVILQPHMVYGVLRIIGGKFVNPDHVFDLGSVSVGSCKDTSVMIFNAGTDTVTLFGWFTEPYLLLVTPMPKKLAPGDSLLLTIRYCPTDISQSGSTAGTLWTDTASTSEILALTYKAVVGALSTSGPVDFGCLSQGTSATKTVAIKNTGAGILSGLTTNIQPSGVLTIVHQPTATLDANASDSIVFIFLASQQGNVNATLLISWNGGGPLSVPITAHVAVPPTIVSLDSLVAFDSVTIGDSSIVKCIRVMNPSCVSLKADQVQIFNSASQQFEIVSSDVATLVDSSVATICVRYKPSRIDTASAVLVLTSGRTSYTIGRVTGTGRANPTSVQLALDTVYGRPGQTVNVRVHATNDVTAAGITSVTFRIQFDPMQLDMKTPESPIVSGIQHTNTSLSYSVKRYSLGDQEVTATYPTSLSGNATVASVPFEILLPTSSVAKVHLLSASFGTAPASLVSATDGEIRIEQCDTNERISLGKAPVSIAQNNPNPFNPRTSIRVDVQEAGHVQVEVYDALGVKVMTPFNGELSVGTKLIEIDGSTLASGAYRYFTTWSNGARTVRDEKTMILVK